MVQTADLREWLAENPKMMGALWMLVLVLAETGGAAAANGGAISGP